MTYESVAADVRTRCALRHRLAALDKKPAYLTHDHRKPLFNIIDQAAGTVALALVPYVATYNVDSTTGQILFDTKPTNHEAALRSAMESAVATWALHLLYSGVDENLSRESLETYRTLIGNARAIMGSAKPVPLRPCWF